MYFTAMPGADMSRDTVQFNPFRRVTRHTGVIRDVPSLLSQVTAVADACDRPFPRLNGLKW